MKTIPHNWNSYIHNCFQAAKTTENGVITDNQRRVVLCGIMWQQIPDHRQTSGP